MQTVETDVDGTKDWNWAGVERVLCKYHYMMFIHTIKCSSGHTRLHNNNIQGRLITGEKSKTTAQWLPGK